MTAPIWMAFPPEVHSALLSSGPGPGPLLASAGAWNALSTEYAVVAGELSALVAGVQAGAWGGPSAESYVAANAPYVAWLLQNSANSVAMAAQQQTAATAYIAALAAMPTLPELAANHSIHAVLVGTNFFGINTIPIAVNEADYVRMWVQAATTMATYQTVSTAAVAAAPQTDPAPQIEKADTTSDSTYNSLLQSLEQNYAAEAKYVESLGYTPPSLQTMENILAQYANGYPAMAGDPLSQIEAYYAESFVGPNAIVNAPYAQNVFFLWFNSNYLLPADINAILQGSPAQILSFETVAILFKQVIMTIANVVGIANALGANPVFLTPLLPLITPGLAATSGFAGLAGLAGLAHQAVAAVPAILAPVAPAPLPAIATAPTPISTPASVPAPAPAPAPAVAFSAVPAPPAPGVPPPPPPATPAGFLYLVGVTNMSVQVSAQAKADKPLHRSGSKAPVAAVATHEPPPVRRRRRTKATMLGRGYEYMDFEPEPDAAPNGDERIGAAVASDRGAGPFGLAGAAPKDTAAQAAGLATLADDEFGGGPRMPLMPSTWRADPESAADPAEGRSDS